MKYDSTKSTRIGLLCITLLALIAIIATFIWAAYYKEIGTVNNDFTPASSVNPIINETFTDEKVKENVYFNVGNTQYPVYLRAAIIVTWQKKEDDGSYLVHYSKPVLNEDYELILDMTGWEKRKSEADGNYYYYYTTPVESGKNTSKLIDSCIQINNGPAGYTLNVEIIAQTVQAVGSTDGTNSTPIIDAWKDAWGIS